MDFNPSKRNHKSPSVYSQRDVTACCVSTRSVFEMRALPSRCVPVGATRPPRPPCQSFTAVLRKLRSATFHSPSSQGALPRWPRSVPASVAITRGNVFWPHVELFKSACFTVLLPRKNEGGTIFRSTPPKWILKAEEVAGSFYLARVGWGFLTPFRNIFDSTRPVSDRPKPRLLFRCDYYCVITACCDSLVYLGCTDTHAHAKCKRLSVFCSTETG